MFDKNKPLRKHFKVEDYLDLNEQEKFTPKKIFDHSLGKEIEILFTWHIRGVILD
jgi:hypothetical protein